MKLSTASVPHAAGHQPVHERLLPPPSRDRGGRPRTPEGRGLVVVLRILGLAVLLPLLTHLINPRWVAWARLPLPRWVPYFGGSQAPRAPCRSSTPTLSAIGDNISPTQATRQGHRLVRHSPYRWMRHPLYTSALIRRLDSIGDVDVVVAAGLVVPGTVLLLRTAPGRKPTSSMSSAMSTEPIRPVPSALYRSLTTATGIRRACLPAIYLCWCESSANSQPHTRLVWHHFPLAEAACRAYNDTQQTGFKTGPNAEFATCFRPFRVQSAWQTSTPAGEKFRVRFPARP